MNIFVVRRTMVSRFFDEAPLKRWMDAAPGQFAAAPWLCIKLRGPSVIENCPFTSLRYRISTCVHM